MAGLTNANGASKPFAWTTVFYLLMVLLAPMALFSGSAQAQDNTVEEYGTVIGIDLGTTYSYVIPLTAFCPCFPSFPLRQNDTWLTIPAVVLA